MDSEKHTHMRELLEAGRPVTDEGPFHHHAWWESYKGGVKGKLGGGLIGAGMGILTGGIAVAGITAATAIFPPAAFAIIAGFGAAGLVYGVHEFGDVGKVAGAVAASQKVAEKRLKEFEDSRFDEIKEEISELKALVKGEPVPEKTAEAKADAIDVAQEEYRISHFQGSKVSGLEKFVFWKVALVGLVVGLAAGAILASGGMGLHLLGGLGSAATAMGATGLAAAANEAAAHSVTSAANYMASMTALGAVGASFGINRDIFRQIFDQTDLWFRGFVSHAHSRKVLMEKGTGNPKYFEEDQKAAEAAAKIPASAPEIVPYPSQIAYPESNTYHRDRVLAQAKEALVSMDPAQMRPH